MHEPIVVIARRDGESWAAWSPQCPGLAVIEPTDEALRRAVPEALAFYQDHPDARPVEYHLEHEIAGVVVRVAQDGLRWERQLVAERLAVALGDETQAAEMREGPTNRVGDVVYVCTLPSDTVGWLTRQMEELGDALSVVVPAGDAFVWTTWFETVGRAEGSTLAELGYTESTSLDEIMHDAITDETPGSGHTRDRRHRVSIAV